MAITLRRRRRRRGYAPTSTLPIQLAMITTKKSIHWFPLLSYMGIVLRLAGSVKIKEHTPGCPTMLLR